MRLETFFALFIVVATGCSQPAEGLISRDRALALAQRAAAQHGYDLDKYILSDFGEELTKEEKEWAFAYHCKPVPAPGCHFLVVVDRSTGEADVLPGE